MKRISDKTAQKLGMRIVNVPQTPAQQLNVYNRQTGFRINTQLRKALRNYPGADGKIRIKSFKPVPRPDYELNYGGPYSHIIEAWYNKQWGAVFGLRCDGKIVLWMD
jgi:hypothetical protein